MITHNIMQMEETHFLGVVAGSWS